MNKKGSFIGLIIIGIILIVGFIALSFIFKAGLIVEFINFIKGIF